MKISKELESNSRRFNNDEGQKNIALKFSKLNKQFLTYLQYCFEANQTSDFTPIMKDYIEYSQKIWQNDKTPTTPHSNVLNPNEASFGLQVSSLYESQITPLHTNRILQQNSTPFLPNLSTNIVSNTSIPPMPSWPSPAVTQPQAVDGPPFASSCWKTAISKPDHFEFGKRSSLGESKVVTQETGFQFSLPNTSSNFNLFSSTFSASKRKSDDPNASLDVRDTQTQSVAPASAPVTIVQAKTSPTSFPPAPPPVPLFGSLFSCTSISNTSSLFANNPFQIGISPSFCITPQSNQQSSFLAATDSKTGQNTQVESDEEHVPPENNEMGYEPNALLSVRAKLFFLNDKKYDAMGSGIFNIKSIADDANHFQLIFRLESLRAGSLLMNIKVEKNAKNVKAAKKLNLLITTIPNPPIHEVVSEIPKDAFKTVTYLVKTSTVSDMENVLGYLKD
ncbi:Nuclear pore complex protein Nup50 [Thelohanellus kitauei]|uniref:Nuclear pore complex protein Nup50 n=1 Tax=Thelohanellus kitauei TaxID=669202 RepID=A0A0C2N1P2_THEKT|nr:Nuclear pore complex protein Nup50 [Thelohanellus kitauei]